MNTNKQVISELRKSISLTIKKLNEFNDPFRPYQNLTDALKDLDISSLITAYIDSKTNINRWVDYYEMNELDEKINKAEINLGELLNKRFKGKILKNNFSDVQ